MNRKKNRIQKKTQFEKRGNRKIPLLLTAVVVTGLAIYLVFSLLSSNPAEENKTFLGEPVVQERSYLGKVISMTAITPEINDTFASIPLNLLEEKNIVYFEVENNQGFPVPLMAYITPTGRIFTGSSMCEPCQGRYFSLAGETLLCDTCRTTYTIETREFISGSQACGQYPPVFMTHVIDDGRIKIAMQDILAWEIRAY